MVLRTLGRGGGFGHQAVAERRGRGSKREEGGTRFVHLEGGDVKG